MLGHHSLALALLGIALVVLPSIFLIIASVNFLVATRHAGAICVAAGSVLIGLLSFDFLGNLALSYFMDTTELASVMIYKAYALAGLRTVAIIVLAIGLILLAEDIKKRKIDRENRTS